MRRDYYDILGGAALAAIGLCVSAYAAVHYDFGSLRRMGPGFFPVVLGLMLAGLGLIVAIPAWGRSTDARPFELPETLGALGAIIFFALTMDRIGLILATALSVLIATLPAARKGLGWRLVLGGTVTLLVWLVFGVGLSMTIPLWPWSA